MGTTGLSRESNRSCAKSEDLSEGRHSRSMLRERERKRPPAAAVRGGHALHVQVRRRSHVAPGEAAAERQSAARRCELRRETCGRAGETQVPSEKTLTLLSLRRLRDSLRWSGEKTPT